MFINITINAGQIPSDHWIQDKNIGGGRLLGECCHFIDLARHIAGSKIIDSSIQFIDTECRDTFTVTLKFDNSSIATINYLSNGNKSKPKEFIQVYCQKHIFEIDNFKSLVIFTPNGKSKKIKLLSQDKGHTKEIESFYNALQSNIFPINLDEIFEVTQTTIKLNEKLYS